MVVRETNLAMFDNQINDAKVQNKLKTQVRNGDSESTNMNLLSNLVMLVKQLSHANLIIDNLAMPT
jgi:hypothetical protein